MKLLSLRWMMLTALRYVEESFQSLVMVNFFILNIILSFLSQGTSSPSSANAADTLSPDTPSDHDKTSDSLAAEISRDLSKLQNTATDFHFFSDTEILPGNNR